MFRGPSLSLLPQLLLQAYLAELHSTSHQAPAAATVSTLLTLQWGLGPGCLRQQARPPSRHCPHAKHLGCLEHHIVGGEAG